MKRTFLLILSLVATSVFSMKAEMYYYFDHVTTADGLPSNTIYCTMQDMNGFMWIGSRDGLSRYDGKSFRKISELAKGDGIDGNLFAISEDVDGKIWFSNPHGIHIYNPMTGQIKSLGMLGQRSCFTIESDKKGRVWLITDGLVKYDCKTLERQVYLFEDDIIISTATDSYGTTWIATEKGKVYTYDTRTDRFIQRIFEKKIRMIAAAENGKVLMATMNNEVIYTDCVTLSTENLYKADKDNIITCMIERTEGECWIGTQQGLFIRRAGTDYKGRAYHDAATPESISADYITSLSKDCEGNIWVGTYYTGINIWKDRDGEIEQYFMNPSDNSLKGKIVRSICQDNKGMIWLCTEDGWLNRFNPSSRKMKNYKLADGLNLHGLIMDGDRMWICSYGKGMWLFDLDKEKINSHYELPDNSVILGIRTSDGHILAGTTTGLYKYEKTSDSFVKIESIGKDFVHGLYQDSNGIIWVGTYGNGIKCIDEDGTLISHTTISEKDGALPSRFITSFYEDSKHRLWISTEGAGICYAPPGHNIKDLTFKTLTTDNGLPSNITCAVTEDLDGMIWVSTANGIVGLSGEDPKVLELINGSNLIGNQYSYGAVCSSSSGIIYWGNTDGMISLVPSKIRNRTVHEKVIITDILARDSEHSFSLCAEGTSAMVTDKVEVSHKNAASIHISFVSPEFTDRNPLYSYKISRGKDNGFSGMTYENSVTFTGLRAGKYRFEVSIAGKQDIPECNRSLEIHIQPHPMLSSTAFIMYALFSIAIIATLVLLYELKRKRDKARHLTKITIKKEKEIFNAKINFFTNITHEIRTPLSLIKMPIDKIISSGAYNASNEKDLRIIQANTDRLLNLTNQLLDMRKMENNEISVSFVKEDLCMIVKKALMLFEQMASEQHMKLTSEIPDSPVYAMCAKDSVFSIMSNLISNAVKYGNGQIIVKISYTEDQQSVIIRVNSDGEIIPKQDRENIFKLFFQREGAEKGVHGTGLGLPYARTLANMHNGRLYLDDSVKDMNSFVLELPVKQAEQIIMEQPVVDSETDLPVFDSSRHTILIVEDSAEMRKYLAKEISAEYNVKLAANGKDALEILKKEKIDLVISDIMMPIMDGCELCNIIKTDSDLSHVPIILLTAAVGVETRIETLESGADGYIEKPFPMELLMSNINNLFRNKEISYKQFISKPLTHYNSVTTNKVDQNYMDKVHEFIMKHISEPDLNIESLTMEIGTSKSSLYRKLKANTGLSINEYIRLCRLKQAAELLSSQKYKINEVAFMTGFSSPSYFATCFLKQFNLTPSEFVKNLGE